MTTDRAGRLTLVRDDRRVICQLLALAVDHGPGDLPGAAHIADPCDAKRVRSALPRLDALARRVARFLRMAGLAGVRVRADRTDTGESRDCVLGQLVFTSGRGQDGLVMRLGVVAPEPGQLQILTDVDGGQGQ